MAIGRPKTRWSVSQGRWTATRTLKQQFPQLIIVGTAYTYLQDFLPNVAQAAVREGWADSVGLGRMVLSYPELPLARVAGPRARTKARVPHIQRLHDRAAQWLAFGVLSARRLLQKFRSG